jgi:predicted kinase
MFPRDLRPPRSAFFLFGPRGTGKSTWIHTHFDHAYVVNLLPRVLPLESFLKRLHAGEIVG